MYEKILKILAEVKPSKNLEGIDDIIESGYLDSFELMMLIGKLSDIFEIEIGFEDIIPENFNSIDNMVTMVKKLSNIE